MLSALNSKKASLLSIKNAGKAALLKSATNSGKARLLSALNSKKAALHSIKNAGKAALLKSASNAGKAKLLSALNSNKAALLNSRNGNKAALLAGARKNLNRPRSGSSLLLVASRQSAQAHLLANAQLRVGVSAKLGLAARASAAASRQHAQLQQAKRSAHNFKASKHNGGPNKANAQHLLQQQKNPPRFQQILRARSEQSGATNPRAGSSTSGEVTEDDGTNQSNNSQDNGKDLKGKQSDTPPLPLDDPLTPPKNP